MRQVMTVSLNNNAYQIDEEAYRALRSYLDRSRSGLHGNPDADEIIEDLERSIGEKCAAALRPGKNVVSFEEMGQILHDTGPVAEETNAGPLPAEPPQATRENGAPKRLYKRRSTAVIEGVCAGIAEYFAVDVVIVRVLFAAFLLVTGFSGILYLILIFAMPEDPAKITDPAATTRILRSVKTVQFIIAIILMVLIGLALLSYSPWNWSYSYGNSGHVFFGQGRFHEILLLTILAVPLIVLGIVRRSIAPIAAAVLLLVIAHAGGLFPLPFFMMSILGILGLAMIALAIWCGVHLIRHNRSVSN